MLRNLNLVGRSNRGVLSRCAYGTNEKPFDKILIANRGEIACRIMSTAKKLGVKTVAVYSEADASSMFVRMADEAYCIGPAPSSESYLRMDRILEIAKKTGAQGIHPGYGFLSENAKFVDLVESNGIKFIGPSSLPMTLMGDKINSKKIAQDAGCFTIPGFQGEVADENEAVKIAHDIGFPVMIKASAGGGGKGMRVAYNDDEVREGFKLSKAEALSSFGDDRMLIERFIEDPHHIEIQVLADEYGNVVAFPERECSVQRRNQKVIEESPSPYLSEETRRKMQEQAILLCKATKYKSAGTIEMLADNKQNFFFLEMNTRLQVEHPITELVSGEDLVEHMLWIAAGKKLPERFIKNPYLNPVGNAIESRVYAEDPIRNFLPSIGPLLTYQEPEKFVSEEGTVRLDTGVYAGGNISIHYDPMIAKLCSHASDRSKAITLMEKALDSYVIQGLGNNLNFLRDVMRNKNFREGNYCTKFIPQEYPNGFKGVQLNPAETAELIAITCALQCAREELKPNTIKKRKELLNQDNYQPYLKYNYVTVLGGPKGQAFDVEITMDNIFYANITPLNDKNEPQLDQTQTVALSQLNWEHEQPLALASILKDVDEEIIENAYVQYVNKTNEGYLMKIYGSEQEVIIRSKKEHEYYTHMIEAPKKDFSKMIQSPMPGTLISIAVTEGQEVEEGQEVAVIEAMKMQNVLKAAKKGKVKSIKKVAGSPLKVDEVIVEFE